MKPGDIADRLEAVRRELFRLDGRLAAMEESLRELALRMEERREDR